MFLNHSAPALIIDEQIITYSELNKRITQTLPSSPFVAENTLDTIVRLFTHFQANKPAFPLRQRERAISIPSLDADLLLHTSGSFGSPKIAALTVDNFIASAQGALSALSLKAGDRWLLSLPLYHVGGIAILFRCFLAGATVVLSSLPMLAALHKHAITHLSLVPTQLYRLLEEEIPHLPSLKCLLIGGGPCGESLLKEGANRGLPLITSYGMTEMASLITCSSHMGVLPGRELTIDENQEILVRGDVLFKGYWDDSLHIPLTEEGWFATRDLGRWENGKLCILGRKDNLFISGGENIHPEEIEKALCSLNEVIEAIVIPIEDLEWGARPVAFVRLRKELTLKDVHKRFEEKLPRFKHPVALYPLPEAAGLKPCRKQLIFSNKTRALGE